jgi:hypothetical protein
VALQRRRENRGTLWHEDHGQSLRIEGILDPGDDFDTSVRLTQQVRVDGAATLSPCTRQAQRSAMVWIDLTPTQAM